MKKIGLVFLAVLFMVNFASAVFAAPANLITDDDRTMAVYREKPEGNYEIWKKVAEMPPIPDDFPAGSDPNRISNIFKAFEKNPATKITGSRTDKKVIDTIFPKYTGKEIIQNWELTMVDGKFIATHTGNEEKPFSDYYYACLIIASLFFLSPLVFSTKNLEKNYVKESIVAFCSYCAPTILIAGMGAGLLTASYLVIVLIIGLVAASVYSAVELISTTSAAPMIALGTITIAASGKLVEQEVVFFHHAIIISIVMAIIVFGRFFFRLYMSKHHYIASASTN